MTESKNKQMLSSAIIGPKFLYIEDLAKAEADYKNKIFRLTDFSTHFDVVDKPYVYSQLAIPPLSEYPHELWTSSVKVEYKRIESGELARAGALSLVRIVMPEPAHGTGNRHSGLAEAGYQAYSHLFAGIGKHDLGRLIRIWNYVPNILTPSAEKTPSEDRERYRQFNIGRYDAWQDHGPRDGMGNLLRPSATGVGTHNGPLVIEAIVSHEPSVYIENPRQTPAYHYPPEYGSKAPAFARGTLHLSANFSELYLAGTASIVGSETLHKDDLKAQIAETFRNIEALISHENMARYDHTGFKLSDFIAMRTYIKNPDDYAQIRRELEKIIGTKVPMIYLNNDICRPDLLLEIEGIARKKS